MTVALCSTSAFYQQKNYEKLKGLGQTEAQAMKAALQGHLGFIKGSFQYLEEGEHLFDARLLGKFPKEYKVFKSGSKVKFVRQDFDSAYEVTLEGLEKYLTGEGWEFALPGQKSPVSMASKSLGNMSDEDVATMFVKTKDEIAKAKGINIKGVNPDLDRIVYEAISKQIGYTPTEVKAKVDAYKATGKKLSTLKKKVVPKTEVKVPHPNGVPTAATEETAHKAAEEAIEHIPAYMDEDVAKAYIKAKDQLAADPDNPWTLYTQNNDQFDAAIYKLMEQSYGIHLPPNAIKNQISNYLGGGNKLSVLKKKMAKSGEYKPQADTLKKKKGDPTGVGKQSKTGAQKTIGDAADSSYHPGEPFVFNENSEEFVFNNLKNDIFAAINQETLYNKFATLSKSWKNYYPNDKEAPSVLDLVRVYDKKKAKQLGIENGHFYEKKVAEYASSPAGKAQIQAAKDAAELEKNLPPLPADSLDYQVISPEDAKAMQRTLDPWTPAEREGLTIYTGGTYREMNSYLRKGGSGYISDYARKAITGAQKGMRAMPRKLLVHRGCDFQQFGFSSYEQALKLVGKTVQDKGFLSTSAGGRGAFSGSVNLEIEVPQGAYAAYVQSISNFPSEKELLIAAGTKYEVLSVSKSGYQTTIRIRAIPGSHTRNP